MARPLAPFTTLLLFATGPLLAQSVGIATATSDADAQRRAMTLPIKSEKDDRAPVVPTLYEGELEDIGPQMLLLEAPPHDWFAASADLQNYYTSNATLSRVKTWSDVTVITGQAGLNSKPIKLGDTGQLAFSTGYLYQQFLYGELSGRTDEVIANSAGVKLDELNFTTHTLYLNGDWISGGWSAGAGVRYAAYIENTGDTTTYQEYAPTVHGGYRWMLNERNFINLHTDATYRLTRADTGISSVSLSRNDRYDLGVSASYSHIVGTKLLLQPSYRLQYSNYTEADLATRVDYLHTFAMTAGYYFNQNFSLRAFGTLEFRNSNEAEDYDNTNLGGGAMVAVTF